MKSPDIHSYIDFCSDLASPLNISMVDTMAGVGAWRNVANSLGASSSEGGAVVRGGPSCCEASSMRAQLGNTRRSGSGQQPLPSEDQLQARNTGACQVFPYPMYPKINTATHSLSTFRTSYAEHAIMIATSQPGLYLVSVNKSALVEHPAHNAHRRLIGFGGTFTL